MAETDFFSWYYNVQDHLKGLTTEQIKEKLYQESFPYAVCLENMSGNFNLGTVIRNANGFGAREVFYLKNRKKYDKRSTVGTHHYTEVNWLNSIVELQKLRDRYSVFIGIDNIPGSISINDFVWPLNCLCIFGEEGPGLSPELVDLCDIIVNIPMYGSVRSFNAGTASGIIMQHITSQWTK